MDPAALIRNLREAARVARDPATFCGFLAWTYSHRLPQRWRERERRLRLRLPEPLADLDLLVRDNRGSDRFIYSEVLGRQVYAAHPGLGEVRSILDLGANIGLTALFYARCHPGASIIAVEPHPGNAALLRANLALNRVHASVVEAACVARDTDVDLRIGEKDYGHSLLAPPAAPASGATIRVAGYSVPTLMRRHGVDRIDLLKVDIEGYERTLLTQAADWLAAVRALVVEWHFPDAEPELARIAAAHGFRPPQRHSGQLWLLRG